MRPAPWKVGELAKRTGVSVRTLHYYDEIGLLTPSHHSEAGYRLYTESDVVRLQQIKSLQSLGWSLDEVRECLKSPGFAPQRVVELHLALVREQIELQERLRDRLEGIAKSLRSAETVSVEDFLQTIEVITMLDKYYTPEQRKELEERRRQTIGDERIRQVEGEWKELMEQVRAEMEKGADPASETVQALARRWMGLVREFTGGNPGIEKSLGTMYQQETTVHGMDTGPMKEMMAYIQKAMEAGKKPQ
jgi:DNA-binding transcriptional MerR regulator